MFEKKYFREWDNISCNSFWEKVNMEDDFYFFFPLCYFEDQKAKKHLILTQLAIKKVHKKYEHKIF